MVFNNFNLLPDDFKVNNGHLTFKYTCVPSLVFCSAKVRQHFMGYLLGVPKLKPVKQRLFKMVTKWAVDRSNMPTKNQNKQHKRFMAHGVQTSINTFHWWVTYFILHKLWNLYNSYHTIEHLKHSPILSLTSLTVDGLLKCLYIAANSTSLYELWAHREGE